MKAKTFEGDLFSVVVRNIVAPLWAMREHSPYLKYLKYLEKSQYRPRDEVRQDQLSRFRALLEHACKNSEYYFEKMKSVGLEPADIKSWDDFRRLPLLTKDDIRANKNKMVARNFPRESLVPKKTSGSTGVSLEFFWDENCSQWKRACTIRHNMWTGWKFGERIAAVWGNPRRLDNWRAYLRDLLLDRCTYLDTLKMNEADMLYFYHRIKREKPTLMYGHAHSLRLLGDFLHSRGLTDVRPKGVISTAMVLHEYERKKIENFYGCRVTDRYGCEEVSLIASECEEHNGLHVNMDTLIAEAIAPTGEAVIEKPGALVVTDLTNYGMPFIRYKIGDVAILSDRQCKCGRTYSMIESVEGRSADYITTPEGNFISGISLTENLATLLVGVKQFQIVQERIDYLVLKIVKAEDFDRKTEQQVAELVKKRFGPRMQYSIEYVEKIPQESSGKYRFCISKIPNPFSEDDARQQRH